MSTPDSALAPFEVLIGTWETEATHPMTDAVVPGTVTFEWLSGQRFIVQRSHNEHEQFPDAICVIGHPEAGAGLVMEYFDSRGVRRTYGISFDRSELRMWREEPNFSQRFAATVASDRFVGQWQLARTRGDWKDDLRVLYGRSARTLTPRVPPAG
jgi:hypothetical protein